LKRQLDKSITTPGSGTGGAQTTASATATTTQVASYRCRTSDGCRPTGAAASSASPAATAGISLSVAAALGASLSSCAGKTGSLRRAAGLSHFLGAGTAVPAASTSASTGLGCAALSSDCSLGTWCPNVGTREPGDELPGIVISQAGRATGAGLSAYRTHSDRQLIHSGRQVLSGPQRSRTGTAAPATAIARCATTPAATATAQLNDVAAFNQKGRLVLRTGRGRLRRMYREQTLLIHGIRSRTDDRENVPYPVVVRAFALRKRALRKSRSRSTRQ